MTSLLDVVQSSFEAFSRAPWWRGECRVWDYRLASATFDRWLYLRLHKFGRMGGEERAALERYVRPGMTVVDVGSNLGLYTVLLSHLVGPTGRVLAFEPDPGLFVLLQRNCALNGCANVTAYNLALGSKRERLLLHTTAINSGDNHLGDGGSRLLRRSVQIEVVPLDEIAPGLRPDLVKIDVQGWELEVLKGMQGIFANSPQTEVYFEFWPEGYRRAGSSAAELLGWLRELGFHFYEATGSQELGEAAFAALTRRLTGLKHADLFATRDQGP
jgi:FkbM family methyltransferase